jgi:hypothetical protein
MTLVSAASSIGGWNSSLRRHPAGDGRGVPGVGAVDFEVIVAAGHRLGVELDRGPHLIDLAAVAVTRLVWRDGPVEDWHAAPASRVNDAEMMRANVATTRLVRSMIGRLEDGTTGERDAARIVEDAVFAAVAPSRRLPDGRTIAELAPSGPQLLLLQEHALELASLWGRRFREFGVRDVLSLLACCAARCWRWWLTPTWPAVVDAFLGQISTTLHGELIAPGEAVGEHGAVRLAEVLLAGPDHLRPEVASWVVRAGLGHLLPQDCGLSPMPRRPLPAAFVRLVTTPAREGVQAWGSCNVSEDRRGRGSFRS